MGEEKKNNDLAVLAIYASLQKAAKSYLEYSIEIRPISNYAERKRAWKISSLGISIDIGSSILEYGISSGKSSAIGIYLGQRLISMLSKEISSSWPKPPEIDKIKRIINSWLSEVEERIEISEWHKRIIAKGISSLLLSLFTYVESILETSVSVPQDVKESWIKILEMPEEELEKSVLLSLSES